MQITSEGIFVHLWVALPIYVNNFVQDKVQQWSEELKVLLPTISNSQPHAVFVASSPGLPRPLTLSGGIERKAWERGYCFCCSYQWDEKCHTFHSPLLALLSGWNISSDVISSHTSLPAPQPMMLDRNLFALPKLLSDQASLLVTAPLRNISTGGNGRLCWRHSLITSKSFIDLTTFTFTFLQNGVASLTGLTKFT